MRILLKLFPAAEGVFLIEENKPEAIAAMEKACAGDEKLKVHAAKCKYPQGGERSIIQVIAGIDLKLGMLPADAGCVVDNVATMYAIYQAVCKSTPLMERGFTVSGDVVKEPCNLIVKIGTNMAEVLEAAGGIRDGKEAQKLVDVTEECFWLGANMARSGNHLGDISHAVQTHAEAHGYGVIRDLCGHGIGQEMHEDPNVPNYGKPGRGVKLQAGMTIAIEPMISMGTWKVFVDDNDWTICTQDGSIASHYEHTVLITDGEPEILSYPGMEVKKVLERIK